MCYVGKACQHISSKETSVLLVLQTNIGEKFDLFYIFQTKRFQISLFLARLLILSKIILFSLSRILQSTVQLTDIPNSKRF